MTKKKGRSDPFADLTWDDLEQWAGSRIVSRGQGYQRQGRVSGLALTNDGGLIAWVSGSQRYATMVVMAEDGVPNSMCTCPYGANCKHGVAVVLEYLERIESNKRIPKTGEDDERLVLLEGEGREEIPDDDEAGLPEPARMEIEPFLQEKSKAQLVELLLDIAEQHPDIAQDLMDRQQITSGSAKTLIARLRKEIHDMGQEPGWRDYWNDEGYTPDYSGICSKLNSLLEAGYADEVLSLGRELVIVGTCQVEESHDDGGTFEEVAACMPVIARALDQSSLTPAAKLAWAVEAVLKDQYDICSSFVEYLDRQHPKEAWDALASQLLAQLKALKPSGKTNDFSPNYARDRLSDWAIHALQKAGRTDEILPLCEAEAPKTLSYDRLVDRLIRRHRYEDAERWIHEGIRATEKKWPGIGHSLRDRLKAIRAAQKDLPALVAMEVEEFVRSPSQRAFADCEKASREMNIWPRLREHLLTYLESGRLPWKQKDWLLPAAGLDAPEPSAWESFPLLSVLIDIAIHEKDPERVLRWYDQRSKKQFGWVGVDEDRIASAIQTHAPDRAVAIWTDKAERLIAQVKPSAYEAAAGYLRKAGAVMAREGKQQQWTRYLQDLRVTHARKSRFIQILDRLSGKPVVTKGR
jgi:uncharacterized Zn finger protein